MSNAYLFSLMCEVSNGEFTSVGQIPLHWFNTRHLAWVSYVEFAKDSNNSDHLWDIEVIFNTETAEVIAASIVDNRYSRASRWVAAEYYDRYYSLSKQVGYDLANLPASITASSPSTATQFAEYMLNVVTMIHGRTDQLYARIKQFLDTSSSSIAQQIISSAVEQGKSISDVLVTNSQYW